MWRESVDVGVGTIYGPFGCEECGWSEHEEYDLSTKGTALREDGTAIDQWGNVYPHGNLYAAALRAAKKRGEDV